jgi:hypothetical protein
MLLPPLFLLLLGRSNPSSSRLRTSNDDVVVGERRELIELEEAVVPKSNAPTDKYHF